MNNTIEQLLDTPAPEWVGEFSDVFKELIVHETLFAGGILKATRPQHGIASQVAIVESVSGMYVVKTTEYDPRIDLSVFNAWNQVGVKTPLVRAVRDGQPVSYEVLDYIAEPVLEDVYRDSREHLEHGSYAELAVALHDMHQARAEGYGLFKLRADGSLQADYATFEEWIASQAIQEKLGYTERAGLLAEFNLAAAHEILTARNTLGESSYSHNDLTLDNVFATDPRTVFDPKPSANDPLLDVATTALRTLALTKLHEASDQVLQTYRSKAGVSQEELDAAILFKANLTVPYLHKANKSKRIDLIREYLHHK